MVLNKVKNQSNTSKVFLCSKALQDFSPLPTNQCTNPLQLLFLQQVEPINRWRSSLCRAIILPLQAFSVALTLPPTPHAVGLHHHIQETRTARGVGWLKTHLPENKKVVTQLSKKVLKTAMQLCSLRGLSPSHCSSLRSLGTTYVFRTSQADQYQALRLYSKNRGYIFYYVLLVACYYSIY